MPPPPPPPGKLLLFGFDPKKGLTPSWPAGITSEKKIKKPFENY